MPANKITYNGKEVKKPYISKGNQTFIDNYLHYEAKSGLSRDEISKRADIKRSRLDLILEKGFHSFNLILVQDLAIALGCTMTDLIGTENTDTVLANRRDSDTTTWEDLAMAWRTLSHNLSYIMHQDGWTINRLATISGVRARNIEGILNGATGYLGPNLAVIVKLARALGVKQGDLLDTERAVVK